MHFWISNVFLKGSWEVCSQEGTQNIHIKGGLCVKISDEMSKNSKIYNEIMLNLM